MVELILKSLEDIKQSIENIDSIVFQFTPQNTTSA